MPKRSRPSLRYFLILMGVYVIIGIGIEVQLWSQFTRLMSEGNAGVYGEKGAIDVIKQNQEMIPAHMRKYVQAVASY